MIGRTRPEPVFVLSRDSQEERRAVATRLPMVRIPFLSPFVARTDAPEVGLIPAMVDSGGTYCYYACMNTKTCAHCKQIKQLTDFALNPTRKDGRQSTCKSCMAEYARRWYTKNKKIHGQRRLAVTRKIQQLVLDFLYAHPCQHCGEANPVVLDFHHATGEKKVGCISTLIRKGFGKTKITAEMNKCSVLCANCHRIETAAKDRLSGKSWFRDFGKPTQGDSMAKKAKKKPAKKMAGKKKC